MSALGWPRRIPIEVSSFWAHTQAVQHFATFGDFPIVTPHQQRKQGSFPTRTYIYFTSPFRTADLRNNLISMQSTVIARLEARDQRLEQAVANQQA